MEWSLNDSFRTRHSLPSAFAFSVSVRIQFKGYLIPSWEWLLLQWSLVKASDFHIIVVKQPKVMATVKERHPEVYRESNEDPRKRTRTVPMEVLSLGMSRTGTMSMKAAFETLGIPSWHWVVSAIPSTAKISLLIWMAK